MGSWTTEAMMRGAGEVIRFAICLAIVIVGCFCALYVATVMQDLSNVMERQAQEMLLRME